MPICNVNVGSNVGRSARAGAASRVVRGGSGKERGDDGDDDGGLWVNEMRGWARVGGS